MSSNKRSINKDVIDPTINLSFEVLNNLYLTIKHLFKAVALLISLPFMPIYYMYKIHLADNIVNFIKNKTKKKELIDYMQV